MQITIYLSDELIRKLDALAKKQGRSRSNVIQAALSRGLEAEKAAEHPIDTLSTFGAWKDLTVDQVQEFRKSFAKDAPRLKLKS